MSRYTASRMLSSRAFVRWETSTQALQPRRSPSSLGDWRASPWVMEACKHSTTTGKRVPISSEESARHPLDYRGVGWSVSELWAGAQCRATLRRRCEEELHQGEGDRR